MRGRHSRRSKSLLGCLLLLLACCSGPPGESGLLNVHGKVVGDFVPGTAKLMVFWKVISNPPEYLRKFGQVTTNGENFALKFEKTPPNEAINNATYGVGSFLLAPYSCDVKEENISQETLLGGDCKFSGSARAYIIVYKQGKPTDPPWITAFPPGYSCAHCITGRDEGKATLAPAPCGEVEIHVGNIEFCNWS
jgi:hypothetical protein